MHLAWIRTPRKKGGLGHMQIPLLADVDRRIAAAYGTLNADNFPNRGIYLIDPQARALTCRINAICVPRRPCSTGAACAHVEPLTARFRMTCVMPPGAKARDLAVVDAICCDRKRARVQGKLKSMQILQNDVGRSVDEALRLLDAYQYVEKNGVVCPANWKPGGETMEADPDGSLKYFSQAESSQDEHAFGETLTAITSRAQYEEVTGGSGAAVVRAPPPCRR